MVHEIVWFVQGIFSRYSTFLTFLIMHWCIHSYFQNVNISFEKHLFWFMQVMSQELIQEIPHPTAGTVRLPGKEPNCRYCGHSLLSR